MSRVVRSPWLLTLVLAVLLGGSLWYASCSTNMNASLAAARPIAAQQPPAPSSVELTDALLLAGLDAKALTAVGLSANGAAAFVDAFRDAYAGQAAAILASETSRDAAQVASDALRRKIESGKGSAEDVSAYHSQTQALASAKSAIEAALAASRAPAEALLSSEQRAQLARIRANKSWDLPMQYLLVDRTQTEWVALRAALANEKIAPRYGGQTAPEHASVLSAARSNNDVALAKSRLDTNLTPLQAAIHAAIVE